MSEQTWQDRIVGARMAVDREFDEYLQSSSFSNQQWGLIMTATEFELENPENPEDAQIVANTENIAQIMPEVEKVAQQMGGMGGGEPGGESGGGGGLLDGIKGALGLGGGSSGADREKISEAKELTQQYANELQSHLKAEGRWEDVCQAAQH